MNIQDFASKLFGSTRIEESGDLSNRVDSITAAGATASEAGAVGVTLDAEITPADDSSETDETIIEMPTSPSVDVGDDVIIGLTGEGPLKVPVVLANPGSGDRIAADASAAREIAEATGQHFWDDTNGAHVTEATREEWEQQQTGPNSLWNSLGMLFRNGLNNLLALVTGQNPGVAIYDGQGNEPENIVASFTRDGAQIGSTTDRHLIVDSTGIQGVNQEGATVFDIDMTGSAAMRARSTAIRFMPYLQTTTVAQGTTPPPAQDAYLFSTDTASLSELDAGTTVDIVSTFYVKPDVPANKFTGTPTVSGCTATVSGTGMALDGTVSITQITVGTPSSHTATVRVALASGGYYGARMVIDFDGTDFTATMYQSATTSRKYSSFLRAVGTYITLVPAAAFTFGTRADDDAPGALSCAIGEGLYAESDFQTVLGKFNEADTAGTYAVIVGNGDDDANRSNIFTMDWDGDITAGTYNGWNIDTMGNRVIDMLTTEKRQLTRGSGASSWVAGQLKRSGNTVTVTIVGMKLASALASKANSAQITTLPAGFIPNLIQRVPCAINGAGNFPNVWAAIGTGGGIQIHNGSPTAIPTDREISLNCTYIID